MGFGSDFLTALGAGLNPMAAQLLQRQQELAFDRDTKAKKKATVQDQLQALIGTAPTEAVPFNPEASPLLPVEAQAGTGLGANMTPEQVQQMSQIAAISPETVLKQISTQAFPTLGKDGFTLKPGQTRFDAQGNAIAGGGVDPAKNEKKFDKLLKLRNNFERRTNDFAKQDDAFGRIRASINDPSAAGDLSLVFNYMKLLDPGSTVREGEFATVKQAGGVDDRTIGLYNSVLNGTILSPKQRSDFENRAQKLYSSAFKSNEKRRSQSAIFATKQGLDPEQATFERANQIDERKTIQHKGKTVRAYRVGKKWFTY